MSAICGGSARPEPSKHEVSKSSLNGGLATLAETWRRAAAELNHSAYTPGADELTQADVEKRSRAAQLNECAYGIDKLVSSAGG